jgi:hypothetical protein
MGPAVVERRGFDPSESTGRFRRARRQSRRALIVGAASGALAALAAAAVLGTPSPFETFRMPSGNIGCLYERGPRVLRCDILSGLRPEPARGCELDWTGITLAARGRARAQCAGDTVYDRRARVLRYGSSWARGGITCRSRRDGLRCANRAGRGFFLARERWRVF